LNVARCKPCKGTGYIPRDPMPKGVKDGVGICLDCDGTGEAKVGGRIMPPPGQPDHDEILLTAAEPCTLGYGVNPCAEMDFDVGLTTGRVIDYFDWERAVDAGTEAHKALEGDDVLTVEKMQEAMARIPNWMLPVQKPTEFTYDGFKERYTKSPTGRAYGGTMRDLLRQSSYAFSSGSADFLRKGDAMRRYFVLGEGEGNRQLAYYAYGMAVMQDNRIDDVYNRRQRRAEADLRRYCQADVWFTADYAAMERMILLRLLLGYTPARHALPAPYGYPMGTPISLQRSELPDRQTADMIGGLMVGWGCPTFVARRVADCMFANGRYDCRVTVSEHGMRNLFNAAMALRVIVSVADGAVYEKQDSNRDIK